MYGLFENSILEDKEWQTVKGTVKTLFFINGLLLREGPTCDMKTQSKTAAQEVVYTHSLEQLNFFKGPYHQIIRLSPRVPRLRIYG